jgi:choline dehydrogenase-like flavoprotein
VQTEGLGNGRDLVGRFFADHPNIDIGYIQTIDRGIDLRLYDRFRLNHETDSKFRMMLRPEAMRANELVSGCVDLARRGTEADGARALRSILRNATHGKATQDLGANIATVAADLGPLAEFTAGTLWHGLPPIERVDVQLILLETAPNPDSRVTLGDETDALGMRRVRLDWQLTELDERTFRYLWDSTVGAFSSRGLGRGHQDVPWEEYGDHIYLSHHNLCTTRMSEDPAEGVVDADCRVHGIDNLYLAGGSVFPTSGTGSPTLMIAALAVRLADHLKERGT